MLPNAIKAHKKSKRTTSTGLVILKTEGRGRREENEMCEIWNHLEKSEKRDWHQRRRLSCQETHSVSKLY